ncbi:MAG: shikimate kinase [Taibaiella sp.]|jgi:shikimate kinase
MTSPKRMFIIGHTGALKALTGEALASKLGLQFIDANPGLERYVGKHLNEILGTQGEEAFHECEAKIIAQYISKNHIVVILEEAVIATQKNRELLSAEFVVYLKVSTQVQMERWSSGRTPLLPIENLQAFLEKQHLERDHLFAEVATLTVDSTSVEENVKQIIKQGKLNVAQV